VRDRQHVCRGGCAKGGRPQGGLLQELRWMERCRLARVKSRSSREERPHPPSAPGSGPGQALPSLRGGRNAARTSRRLRPGAPRACSLRWMRGVVAHRVGSYNSFVGPDCRRSIRSEAEDLRKKRPHPPSAPRIRSGAGSSPAAQLKGKRARTSRGPRAGAARACSSRWMGGAVADRVGSYKSTDGGIAAEGPAWDRRSARVGSCRC
jgi:hypothetical protein